MTHIEILFKLLVLSITFFTDVSSTTVTTECVENCNIVNGKINGGEGDTITLKYNIIDATSSFTFTLKFGGYIINAKEDSIVGVNDPLFDFSDTAWVRDGKKHSFSFKVLSLSRGIHNGKQFKSKYTGGETKEDVLTVNVQYGPEFIEGLMPTYDVKEGGDIRFNLTLSGNPKPVVLYRSIFGLLSMYKKQLSSDTYLYEMTLTGYERWSCGKIQTFFVTGYKHNVTSPLEVSTKINVIFVPDIPNRITSAIYNASNCLVVEWNKISSGKCNVSYTLKYEYINGTSNGTIISPPAKGREPAPARYEKCFDINTPRTGRVSIQATMSGVSSDFSTAKIVETISNSIRPPPTTKSTGTKDDHFRWYYVFIIVSATLILIK